MLTWSTYENDNNIQIVPDGEEELHSSIGLCGCYPFLTQRGVDNKPVVVHSSYDGREVFEQIENTPFHRVRQKFDC